MNLPEFQLLLCCARSRPDAGSVRDLVSKGIDWQLLLNLASQHFVRPILLQSLKCVCWDSVPKEIKLELMMFNRANAQKNLLFTRELLQLIDLFNKNAIPIAAFKGPILSRIVYGDISLREFSDLDVIVAKDNLSKAQDILLARGYQADFTDRDFRAAFQSYQGQYAFRHGNTGIAVDLHWRLSGAAVPLTLAAIWPRLEQVTIAGRTVFTLSQDDLALFLAEHGTKEGWRSLIWVCDFAEVVRKYKDIDWGAVLDRAQRRNSSRSLLLAIALASTLLDAPAPVALIARAHKNSAVRKLAEKAQLGMLRSAQEPETAEFLRRLTTSDRLTNRLWTVAALLATRTVSDYQAMPLPKILWGTYYLTRPFRLAIKLIVMMLRSKKSARNAHLPSPLRVE
jgi:hypothetical protein